MSNIVIVQSSVRPNSAGDPVLEAVLHEVKKRAQIQYTVIDFRKTPLPFFEHHMAPSNPEYTPSEESVVKWVATIQDADYVLILVAEYNYSYTAVLKNAIDHLPPSVLEHKKFLFVGYGWAGGARAIVKLRALLTEFIKAEPSENEANLRFTKEINLDGSVLDVEETARCINTVLDEVED